MDETYYQEELLFHYKHPQNQKRLQHPTCSATHQNPGCGDQMQIMLEIKNNTITDVGFIAQGCAISIAFASKTTEAVKGKPVVQVQQLDPTHILTLFPGTISPGRIKCALLAFGTIQQALASYKPANDMQRTTKRSTAKKPTKKRNKNNNNTTTKIMVNHNGDSNNRRFACRN
ncbi:MAG: iron-sulfur cluster assembly scaffold protein [Candidatus Woesearchaeota archaeon]